MIVSKPKKSTFINLGLAFVAMLALNIALISKMSAFQGSMALYFVLMVISFLGMMLWLQKFMVRFQEITVEEGQLRVHNKIAGKVNTYAFSDLKSWHEVSIKTIFQKYQEVMVDFGKKGTVKFSVQEQEGYEEIKKFLTKKYKSKKRK